MGDLYVIRGLRRIKDLFRSSFECVLVWLVFLNMRLLEWDEKVLKRPRSLLDSVHESRGSLLDPQQAKGGWYESEDTGWGEIEASGCKKKRISLVDSQ